MIGLKTTSARSSSTSKSNACGKIIHPILDPSLLRSELIRNDDFAKFTEREGDIKLMQNQYRQMQMRLESMEQTQLEMQDNAR